MYVTIVFLQDVDKMVTFKQMKKVLKPKAYKELCDWMNGQTVDEQGIYDDDLLRWLEGLGVID